jgi:hypothetical protein
MLQNWLYRGNVAHKDKIYPGQHGAIIDRLFRTGSLPVGTVDGRWRRGAESVVGPDLR